MECLNEPGKEAIISNIEYLKEINQTIIIYVNM